MIQTWIANVSSLMDENIYQQFYDRVPEFRKEKADKLRFQEDKALSVGAWILLEKMRETFKLTEENIYNFLPEWLEEVERDFSHPSLIGWCPFNETWDLHGRQQCNHFLDMVYDVTKAIDKTRPIITVSGSYPTERTDAHDVHDYEQDPKKFQDVFAEMDKGIIKDQLYKRTPNRQTYKTQLPVFVSEYGGIAWVMKNDDNAWGYGESVADEDAFFERLEGLTKILLENEKIFAYCYTQLTDIEQEQNGLLTYQREFKFPHEKYKKIFSARSVIEK